MPGGIDARHDPAEACTRAGISAVTDAEFVAVLLARPERDPDRHRIAVRRDLAGGNLDDLEILAVVERELQLDQLVERIGVAGLKGQVALQQFLFQHLLIHDDLTETKARAAVVGEVNPRLVGIEIDFHAVLAEAGTKITQL